MSLNNDDLAIKIAISGFIFQIVMLCITEYFRNKRDSKHNKHTMNKNTYYALCVPYIKLILEFRITTLDSIKYMDVDIRSEFLSILTDNFKLLPPNIIKYYSNFFHVTLEQEDIFPDLLTRIKDKDSYSDCNTDEFIKSFIIISNELLKESRQLATKLHIPNISQELLPLYSKLYRQIP